MGTRPTTGEEAFTVSEFHDALDQAFDSIPPGGDMQLAVAIAGEIVSQAIGSGSIDFYAVSDRLATQQKAGEL